MEQGAYSDPSRRRPKAIEETAARIKAMDPRNTYALDQAVENLKNQIRHMLETLNPPPEIIESPEFRELMEFLQPSSGQHQGQSTFSRGSGMHGRMKSAVMIQKVTEALAAASKMVKQAALQAQKSGDSQTNASMQHFSNLSMMQMARYLRRKLRKRKVDENGQPILEETDEDILLRSEMEMFCAHAAATMRAMREEIAPRWAPEQQPWLIQESDRQVYDILLAVVPEALFKETEYYQEIQDLRSGQAVFTLRAADRLTEGAKR
ncbi:MAG: hypothetical protein R3C68_09210 [Myxococcota bacterium]